MVDGPLKWHGGKAYLAQKIIELMPPRCKNPNAPAPDDPGWLHYVEPFAGGLSVLLANDPEGISEVANDLNGELTNFWQVLQQDISFGHLVRLAEMTPFSQTEWSLTAATQIERRPIPGFAGYKAGSDGSIWTCWKRKGHGWRYGTEPEMGDEWRELAPYQSDRGYLRYTLVNRGEKRLVGGHILVLESFVGPRPEGHEACHNDGNSSNNTLGNLRWATHSDNEKDKAKHRSDVYRAWRFFTRCRQSLAGRMNGFAPLSTSRTRKGMNEQASAWLNCIEGLPAVHERLKRVVILNRPALEVIRQQDGPRSLFYLDPPYLHATRATTKEYGNHEMSETDHCDLLSAIAAMKGRFLLSGYRSELYDDRGKREGWRRVDFEISNHASGGKEKRRMVESVWMNY